MLVLLAIAYLLQLPTPLRMNTDAMQYFLMVISFRQGHGFLLHHHKAHFPIGYPAVLAMLDAVGWGRSWAFVAWNYVMLAIAVVAAAWLLQRWLKLGRTLAWAVVAMFLLSVATIRYSTIPGSEPTYLAISMLCLACLTAAETDPGRRRIRPWLFWTLGAALTVAVLVRTIGVVLWPAVAWSAVLIWWRRRTAPAPLGVWARRNRLALAAGAVAALAAAGAAVWLASRTAYVREALSLSHQNGIVSELHLALRARCIEAGAILTNIWTHSDQRIFTLLKFLGLPSLPLILLVVARRLRRPGSVDIYLAGYVGLLLLWPYPADNRFWLPVELLIYGAIARELIDLAATPARRKSVGIITTVWLTWFALLGVIALVRSTRLTYAGPQFSERYDLEWTRDTYRLASRNGLPVNRSNVSTDMLIGLQWFGAPQFAPPHRR